MDLSEEEASALFGDDRERDLDALGDFHMGIDFSEQAHVVVFTENKRYHLSEEQKEELLDQLDADSIWWVLSDKLKALDVLESLTDE